MFPIWTFQSWYDVQCYCNSHYKKLSEVISLHGWNTTNYWKWFHLTLCWHTHKKTGVIKGLYHTNVTPGVHLYTVRVIRNLPSWWLHNGWALFCLLSNHNSHLCDHIYIPALFRISTFSFPNYSLALGLGITLATMWRDCSNFLLQPVLKLTASEGRTI